MIWVFFEGNLPNTLLLRNANANTYFQGSFDSNFEYGYFHGTLPSIPKPFYSHMYFWKATCKLHRDHPFKTSAFFRGSPLPTFADLRGVGVSGMPMSAIFENKTDRLLHWILNLFNEIIYLSIFSVKLRFTNNWKKAFQWFFCILFDQVLWIFGIDYYIHRI